MWLADAGSVLTAETALRCVAAFACKHDTTAAAAWICADRRGPSLRQYAKPKGKTPGLEVDADFPKGETVDGRFPQKLRTAGLRFGNHHFFFFEGEGLRCKGFAKCPIGVPFLLAVCRRDPAAFFVLVSVHAAGTAQQYRCSG